MKKIYYNSKIAKLLFNKCHTIALMAWVFIKWSKKEVDQSIINHECIHARQWIELTTVFGLLIWVGLLIFGFSAWWMLLASIAYYVLYVLEFIIRLLLLTIFMLCNNVNNSINISEKAYMGISFEQEARLAEKDDNYLENSFYFAWIRFIFR